MCCAHSLPRYGCIGIFDRASNHLMQNLMDWVVNFVRQRQRRSTETLRETGSRLWTLDAQTCSCIFYLPLNCFGFTIIAQIVKLKSAKPNNVIKGWPCWQKKNANQHLFQHKCQFSTTCWNEPDSRMFWLPNPYLLFEILVN